MLLALLGCRSSTGQDVRRPEIGDADVRVLFVGNSLTYVNDLPGMVQALADAQGRSFAHGTVAYPNFNLEDHWLWGIGEIIAVEAPDVVVMQQGPSSLPENQVHLRSWTEQLAPVIRQAGGEPALLMVWPSVDRLFAFDAVRDSYAGAASAVNGIFIPAGEAWRAAWRLDPELPLFSSDGFHPSLQGSFVAALTTYARLLAVQPDNLDCVAPPSLTLAPETLSTICAAVQETLAAWPASP